MMPFCTQCGHQNQEGSRFCAQCGHRLEQPAGSAGGSTGGSAGGSGDRPETASETTATITFGAPSKEADHRDDRLNESDAAAVDALPVGSALLVVQRGPSAGSRFLLDTDVVTAGRHPDSEIFLDDVTVSRRHAEFRRGPEGYRVSDVGSLNGTYVNRDRIDDVLLQGGDEVQIGKFRLVFFTSEVSVR
jgi:hypothetical protein